MRSFPAGIYLLKVNNRNTRTRCERCSKLTIKTLWRCSSVFIVNFEYISTLYSSVSIVIVENVISGWAGGFLSDTTEERNVSSADNLEFENKLSDSY